MLLDLHAPPTLIAFIFLCFLYTSSSRVVLDGYGFTWFVLSEIRTSFKFSSRALIWLSTVTEQRERGFDNCKTGTEALRCNALTFNDEWGTHFPTG